MKLEEVVVGKNYSILKYGMILEIEVIQINKDVNNCSAKFLRIIDTGSRKKDFIETMLDVINEGLIAPVEISEIQNL